MRSFQYYMKTEVVFGAGKEAETAKLVKKHGGSRCLVVYGGGSAVRSGLLERVCKGLEAAGIPAETFGGVISCWLWAAAASLTPPRPLPSAKPMRARTSGISG